MSDIPDTAPRRSPRPARRRGLVGDVAVFGMAFVVCITIFWPTLSHGLSGFGLLSDELYEVTLPQRVFYAERLAAGEIPLWHTLTGFGYPLLAEGRTGVLYPPNLLLYSQLGANEAYNTSQLLHCLMAFVFTCWYAERLRLAPVAAMAVGLGFVLAWFPVRIGSEWAIVTGSYLPVVLWCVECFLQAESRGRSRSARASLVGLAVAVALQMLAGHFGLAFVTQLTLLVYVPLRIRFATPSGGTWRPTRSILCAVLLGYGLAAVQLVPTWELARRSPAIEGFNPADGYVPPTYWGQIVAPWYWYEGRVDAKLAAVETPWLDAETNRVQAHLYFGLIPVAMAAGAVLFHALGWLRVDRRILLWIVPGAVAFLYTSGWLTPLFGRLPGFGWFRGPGRFGLVATLAIALLAGSLASDWAKTHSRAARRRREETRSRWRALHDRLSSAHTLHVVVYALLIGTFRDLFWAYRAVSPVVFVVPAAVDLRDGSPIRHELLAHEEPQRLYAPWENMPNLYGASSLPVNLRLGPRQYFVDVPKLPDLTQPAPDGLVHADPRQVKWLRAHGVTHVLSPFELAEAEWTARLVFPVGNDPLAAAVSNPPANDPLYLYEFEEPRGRVWFHGDLRVNPGPTIVEHRANRVTIAVDTTMPQRLVLAELHDSGWSVTIDGHEAEGITVDGWFRGVDVPAGRHTVVWRYEPTSVYWGAAVSLLAACILAGWTCASWVSFTNTARIPN